MGAMRRRYPSTNALHKSRWNLPIPIPMCCTAESIQGFSAPPHTGGNVCAIRKVNPGVATLSCVCSGAGRVKLGGGSVGGRGHDAHERCQTWAASLLGYP